jgi:hypothetical protein
MTLAEIKQHIVDVARESKYQYWQSLLTLCGILISVFSVAAVFNSGEKRVFLAALAIIPIVVAFLLVLCFRDTKDIALSLTENIGPDKPPTINAPEYALQLTAAAKLGSTVRHREQAVEGLLFLEAVLIILALFYA